MLKFKPLHIDDGVSTSLVASYALTNLVNMCGRE